MNEQLDKECLPLKPESCRLCFWGTKKGACLLSICHYERPAKEAPPLPSECDGCPYRKVQPCIGWCTRKLMREMGLLPTPKEV